MAEHSPSAHMPSEHRPSERRPYFSVIIPNWNGEKHLVVCLDALRRQTFRSFETIVVDNASHDGSLRLLREQYPEVRVLALPENRFFSGGVRCAGGRFLCRCRLAAC